MSVDGTSISLIGLFCTIFVAIFSAFKYFSAEITSVRLTAETAIATLRRESELRANATGEGESKARMALASQQDAVMTRLRADLDRSIEHHGALALDAVRKSDMLAFEARMMAALTGIEHRMAGSISRADGDRKESISEINKKLDSMILEKDRV